VVDFNMILYVYVF